MLHKAFEILGAISLSKASTIDSISTETGIARSTVHRILQALQADGIVQRHTKQGYLLTPKLLSIGLRGMAEREMLDVAIPVMRVLSENTKETVSLNVLSGYERVCIYCIEGSQPITRNIPIGSNGPLFRGSAGKVIASGLSGAERLRVLDYYVRKNVFHQENVQGLLQDVERVGQQGYAISRGERIPGSASVAVPLKDVMGNVVASLSVSTLESRLTPESKTIYLNHLLEAALQIQQEHCLL